jgi:hypothetical protein
MSSAMTRSSSFGSNVGVHHFAGTMSTRKREARSEHTNTHVRAISPCSSPSRIRSRSFACATTASTTVASAFDSSGASVMPARSGPPLPTVSAGKRPSPNTSGISDVAAISAQCPRTHGARSCSGVSVSQNDGLAVVLQALPQRLQRLEFAIARDVGKARHLRVEGARVICGWGCEH